MLFRVLKVEALTRLALIALGFLVGGCHHYGPVSPETCYAKHVRDEQGGVAAYDRCMAQAERRISLERSSSPEGQCWIDYMEGSEELRNPAAYQQCLGRVQAEGKARRRAIGLGILGGLYVTRKR